MSALCVARTSVTHAQASTGGRLSTSGTTSRQIEPWLPTPEAVRQWSCAFDDWGQLQAWLQARLTRRLAQDQSRDVPVVLLLRGQASAQFDEIAQTLIWPVADVRGLWVGLTLDYEGVGRDRIATLEQLIRNERFWAVVATASLEDDRIALRPYALWGERIKLLDFTERKPEQQTSVAALLARLRAGIATGPTTVVTQTPATDAVLVKSWSNLLRGAEGGGAATQSLAIVDDLDRAGFATVARLYRCYVDKPEADAALRAAYAVATIRLARAQLAWMQ